MRRSQFTDYKKKKIHGENLENRKDMKKIKLK